METFTLSIANTMTPHWYLSVLPFWSRKLPIAEKLRKGIHIVKQVERPSIGVWNVGSRVHSIGISHNKETIVSGSSDGTVRIWNAKTGEAIGDPLQGHTSSVRSVAFSPDGERIVSGSDDRTVRIWNAKTGNAICESLQDHTDHMCSVAFSPDGERIVSGSYDKTLKI